MLPCQLNIAVDGPAGAGKSSVSRAVAEVLGLSYLDTGAMYRSLTWKALCRQVAPDDAAALAELARSTEWTYGELGGQQRLWMDRQPLPDEIRSTEVNQAVSTVSSHASVRAIVREKQQQMLARGGFIADGRDIGTVVLPSADLKVFLTASIEARAARRLREEGRDREQLPELMQAIAQRDHLDSTRDQSPLQQAPDAWRLDTTGMSFQQVVDSIVQRALAICTGEAPR